jgi:hypothetical protein
MKEHRRLFFLYSDALPSEKSGGFAAMLENLSLELAANGIRIITPSFLQSYENKYSIPFAWVPFVSQRLSSMPIWLRFPFLFWDNLIAGVISFFSSNLNSDSDSELVVLIGTDLLGLFRGIASSFIFKPKRTSAYIVDNFLVKYLSNRSQITCSFCILRSLVKYVLSCYQDIYFITDTLRETYVAMLDIPYCKTRVVGLPYSFDFQDAAIAHIQSDSATQYQSRLNFAFIGLLTPLTIACLVEIIEWLDLNHCDCDFYFFCSNYSSDKFSTDHTNSVTIKHYAVNCGQISSIIPINTIFICPHYLPHSIRSSKSIQSLVSDSFPSKLLKMISLNYPVMLISDISSGVARSHSKYVLRLSPSCLSSISPHQAYILTVKTFNNASRNDLIKMHSLSNLFQHSLLPSWK